MSLAYFRIQPREISKTDPLPSLPAEPQAEHLHDLLVELVTTRRAADLPAPWQAWRCQAAQHAKGLSATVYDQDAQPVLSFAVSLHLSHGRPLWRVLTALQPSSKGQLPMPVPRRQWCAWVWHRDFSTGDPRHDLLERLVCALAQAWVMHALPTAAMAHLGET